MRARFTSGDLKGYLPVAPLAASISTVMFVDQVTNRTLDATSRPPSPDILSDMVSGGAVVFMLLMSVALFVKGALELRRRRPWVAASKSEDTTLL
ncbi:MAG: hypothetical protein KVP17_002777 [Porospora cf. gigantea B]|uniref:uncharacterized protein n=1 Tax=Porospora cf. gigantea B TaxID=2853592 RepID=UPI003571C6BC|nr:MAG: hypothetical protein KVP17_002777 [Porospora cf. gigantea B]